MVAVLNGLVGDWLHRSGNGLASPMSLSAGARPLVLDAESLRASLPEASRSVVVLLHGSMGTEFSWRLSDGSDYGTRLGAQLGMTPLYLRYNSGRHISENGEALDGLLEALLPAWPVPLKELTLIGHSMGGLVARSACHVAAEAEHRWVGRVRRAFYLGTPHLGAPLERLGNAVAWTLTAVGNPYTSLLAQVGNLRSAGIKDLRFANLTRADWEGADADALLEDRRHPVPLLPHIRHYLVAGSVSRSPLLTALFGDALVPVPSATASKAARVCVLPGVGHLALARDEAVYQQIRAWVEEAP